MSITLLAIIVGACIIVGLLSIYFWGANNPVEEACEDLIKEETGINIELSPGSTPAAPTPPASTGNKASS